MGSSDGSPAAGRRNAPGVLQKKAKVMGVELPEEIMNFLANRIRTNIRRLEGALIRVASYAALTGKKVTLEVVEGLLREIIHEEGRHSVNIEVIQKKVAEHFDIRLAEICAQFCNVPRLGVDLNTNDDRTAWLTLCAIRDAEAAGIRVIEILQSRSTVEFVPYSRAYAVGFDDMRRRKPLIEKLQALTGFHPATPLRKIV